MPDCPRCRHDCHRTHSYCRSCGRELGSDRCRHCRAAIRPEARFCPACGERVEGRQDAGVDTGSDRPGDWYGGPGDPARPAAGNPSEPRRRRPRQHRDRQRRGDLRRSRAVSRSYDRRHPQSRYARERERTPDLSREEITRRRAMRFGGGLISTSFTFSAIDGVLRLLMDDPPTAVDGEGVEETDGEQAASLDPRTRPDQDDAEGGES